MKYSSIVIFMLLSGSLLAQQQLLTPYSGTLSSAAQTHLQQLQADTNLTQIGLYEVNGQAFYENTLNVNFGTQSFQFFLDRRDEVAMRKVWQGTSIFGDEILVLYNGSNSTIEIQEYSVGIFKIINLEEKIHVIFEEVGSTLLGDDCTNEEVEYESEDIEPVEKSRNSELHCPLRLGMCVTHEAFDSQSLFTRSLLDETLLRVVQSNNAYEASRTDGLFDGISVELAYFRHFPLYTEYKDNGEVKKELRILREFVRDDLEDDVTGNRVTRKYYDADFCGLIYRTNDTERAGGGVAFGLSASYGFAYFIIENAWLRGRQTLTFTHEIGHLFGCIHDHNNDKWWQSKGYGGSYSIDEEWNTIMSYRQRVDNDDDESPILTNRVGLHSNPFLNSSIILSPPTRDLIPRFGLAGDFPNNVVDIPMGTEDDEFCMNGIAKNYLKEINLEVTTRDRYNTVIRTDGVLPVPIPAPVQTPLYADLFIEYADLLTYNDISFAQVSRITDGYQRFLRAGNSIDIDSDNDNDFEFDAQLGSTVDIRIVDFVNSPGDCEPNFWNPKSNKDIIYESDGNEFPFVIYPNPARSNPKIEYQVKENKTVLNLWIVDALGRTVKIIYQNKEYNKGEQKELLDISNLDNGYYRVILTLNGEKLSQELIILK